jgi:hypothetical protein
MYKQLILAHPYLSDRSVVTCDSEQGSMPASNLTRSQNPTDWYRSQGSPGTIHMTFHLPEDDGLLWDLICLGYVNSSEDGTLQVIAAMTEGGLGSPSFEDSVRPLWPVPNMLYAGAPEWRHAFRWLEGNPRSEPWVQLIINDPNPICDPDVVNPFFQAGRLFVALGWQPSYHHDKGEQLMPANEKGRRVVTQGGGTRIGIGPRPRSMQFNVAFLDRNEMMTKGYELDRLVGTSQDLLVCDAPKDPVHLDKGLIIGTLPSPGSEHHDDYESYSRSYQIEESL